MEIPEKGKSENHRVFTELNAGPGWTWTTDLALISCQLVIYDGVLPTATVLIFAPVRAILTLAAPLPVAMVSILGWAQNEAQFSGRETLAFLNIALLCSPPIEKCNPRKESHVWFLS